MCRSLKNIYALLFVFLIQIGCASRNLHKMDQKCAENDQPGSSKAGPVNDSPESPHIENNIDEEVKKFLEQEDYFKQGLVLADNGNK